MQFLRRVQPRELYSNLWGGIGSFAYVSRFPCPCLADYGPAEKCKWPRVIYNDTKAASTLTSANVCNAGKIYNYYFTRATIYISQDYNIVSWLFIVDKTGNRR